MEKSKPSAKQIGAWISMFLLSLLAYAAASFLTIINLIANSMIITILLVLIMFMLLLYLREKVSKHKFNDYFSLKSMYVLAVILPLLVGVILLCLGIFFKDLTFVKSLGILLTANIGSIAVFSGIYELTRFFAGKKHDLR
ncbi:MAG: hypothetical protein RR540_08095 [Oscillospiraceae bacterium]